MIGPNLQHTLRICVPSGNVNAPCEAAKLIVTFPSHPHGFLKAVSGGSQRESGYTSQDPRGTGPMVTTFFRPWWGESAHNVVERLSFSARARIYGALPVEEFFSQISLDAGFA